MITYRGHTNNHGSQHFVDYREGPIYELRADGSVKQIRGTRDPREIFSEVHRFGGWTQVNHPTIFPPVSPAAAALCRGCFWEYSDAETDWSKVDAFEVATGPADIVGTQNPFTVTAIARYDELSGQGYKIAAVGSSDSHEAGKADGPLDAPVGEARTVVYADDLSERGIRCGVLGRHTYAKVAGAGAADIRLDARPWGPWWWKRAIIGDTIRAKGASFTARVIGGNGRQLQIVKDGATVATVPVTSDAFTYRFAGPGPGRWRLQVMRGSLIDTVSSPIWVEPGWGGRSASAAGRPAVGRARPQAGAPPPAPRREFLRTGAPDRAGSPPRRAWWPSPRARRRRRRSAAASGRRSSGRAAWARRRGGPGGRRGRPARS